MRQYLELLDEVMCGWQTPSRAVLLSTGDRPDTFSRNFTKTTYRLERFPIVTTRKISFDVIAHELAWMLSGDTNTKYLREHGITIWDEWSDDDGDLGPIYGASFRAWRDQDRNYDQLASLLDDIRACVADPKHSARRRLILSAWHASRIGEMALPPCHVMCQFVINGEYLSCGLFQRSCDLFLGCPYNVGFYSLLTCLIAKQFGLKPSRFTHMIGDAHIYMNHVGVVESQLMREPMPLPTLEISPDFETVLDFRREHVKLIGYQHRGVLGGEVAV